MRACAVFLLLASFIMASAEETPVESVVGIVRDIQRADYGDDRPALRSLYIRLAGYRDDRAIGTRVLYWRGYALWRRALNGFNDSVDPKEIEQDLRDAVTEFEGAYGRDPLFADAKLAAASCLMNLLYLHLKDPGAIEAYSAKFKPLIKDAETIAPDNPRLLWVIGAALWYMPAEKGGGSVPAIAAYGRGLESINHGGRSQDPLEPSWGEPELLMNLAWANLHKSRPDLHAASQYARAALKIVPEWHYVRDILVPQIEEAEGKTANSTR